MDERLDDAINVLRNHAESQSLHQHLQAAAGGPHLQQLQNASASGGIPPLHMGPYSQGPSLQSHTVSDVKINLKNP
jgi:hypothetical protein